MAPAPSGNLPPRNIVVFSVVSSVITAAAFIFLLLGGALTLNLGGATDPPNWATIPGILPYIAFGILAGYASHEFMMKLKDVAESVFALRRGGDRS